MSVRPPLSSSLKAEKRKDTSLEKLPSSSSGDKDKEKAKSPRSPRATRKAGPVSPRAAEPDPMLTERQRALNDLFDGKSKTARDNDDLEKKHAGLVKKLKLAAIKPIDKVQTNEINQTDIQKVDTTGLPFVYYKLNAFGDKIGRDSKNEPEYFFKGLVKPLTKKELDDLAIADPEMLTSRDSSDDEDTPKVDRKKETSSSSSSSSTSKTADKSTAEKSVKREPSEDKTSEKKAVKREPSDDKATEKKTVKPADDKTSEKKPVKHQRDASDDKASEKKSIKREPSDDKATAEKKVSKSEFPENFTIQLETGGRSQVPFDKDATVRSGIEKIASTRGMKIDEWMFVTLSGQPVDISTTMGKVAGYAIMCVKKS